MSSSSKEIIIEDVFKTDFPRYAGQKNKSKKVESNLNPEFEFTTGYVTEEGGPNELFIGIALVSHLYVVHDPFLQELWDHDVGKDESLGHVSFDIR